MLEKHEVFFWLSSCSGSSALLRSVQIWLLTCILRLRLRSGWTALNCSGPVRRRPSGCDDELHCRRRASLFVNSPSRLEGPARNTAVHSALRTVRLRPLLTRLSSQCPATSYLNTSATRVAECMTASDVRRRTTGRSSPTSGMLHLHPGPAPSGFGLPQLGSEPQINVLQAVI